MKRYPNILCVTDVVRHAQTTQAGLPDGRWVPSRSLGPSWLSHRLRAVWLVWTGKADALTWPGQ